jgi:hypothetical protein
MVKIAGDNLCAACTALKIQADTFSWENRAIPLAIVPVPFALSPHNLYVQQLAPHA